MTTSPDGDREWDVSTVLAYAWAVIEEYGWAPKTVAARGRMSTSDRVALAMGTSLPEQCLEARAEISERIGPHLDRGRQMAPQITAILLTRLSDSAGYEADLAALLRTGKTVPGPQLGLAVSAIAVYKRLAERRLAAEQAAVRGHGQTTRIRRFGKVGQKVTLTGEVVTALKVDGFTRNSDPQIMLVLDCGAAVAKMVTTAGWAHGVHVGDTLTVEATVKAHHSYLGLPQTRLARPKVLNGPVPAKPATEVPSVQSSPNPVWETVRPLPPQARFQQAPLEAASPRSRRIPS